MAGVLDHQSLPFGEFYTVRGMSFVDSNGHLFQSYQMCRVADQKAYATVNFLEGSKPSGFRFAQSQHLAAADWLSALIVMKEIGKGTRSIRFK